MPLYRSDQPVRQLTATELGIGGEEAIKAHSSNRPDDQGDLAEDHPILLTVKDLLPYFGGIIFSGPPGTSKSYFAAKVADKLTNGAEERRRFVQFHPSYQYEDFMQGFVPRAQSDGFDLRPKYFMRMCREAAKQPDDLFVLVIDELSRGDPGRVFGEALTYVERSKRGLPFELASGDTLAVPDNLVILATMNPLDRGVDDVDAAFERRFAKIAMEPDRELLREMLESNGLPEYLRDRIIQFFNKANGFARTNPQATIGHTYFADVTDEPSLRRVWDHQLRFLVDKAYRLVPETRDELQGDFEALFEPPPEAPVGGLNEDA